MLGLWEIDYNGWIIKVVADGYPQAKYRAWKEFSKEFPVSFKDFIKVARMA